MSDENSAAINELFKLADEYGHGIDKEFRVRHEQWPVDLANPGPSEVTVGLLRRQYILATHMAMNPGMWSIDIAPMVLRGMVEVYIWLAWILEKPEERARTFIEDGLGKEKLVVKHRTDEVEAMGMNPEEDYLLNMSKSWIEAQMYSFYIDVNLSSSWSGLDTRKMAEEVGCRDFYRFVYPAYSSTVHSTWNHIGKFDVIPCQNPLHGWHRIPVLQLAPITPDFLFLTAKYLDKTFRLVDEKLGLKCEVPSTYKTLFPDEYPPPKAQDNGASESGTSKA